MGRCGRKEKEIIFFFFKKKEGGGDDGGVLRRLSAKEKKGLMSKEHCEKSTASFSHSSCLYGAGVGG